MMRRRPLFIFEIATILSLACVSHPSAALAEEPARPQSTAYAYKVAFENESVTVMQVRLKPGDTIPMHFHPHHVVYITSPGKLRFAFPEAPPMVSETKIGEVYWGPAGNNSTENIGQTEVNAVVVELKDVKESPAKRLSKLPVCPL